MKTSRKAIATAAALVTAALMLAGCSGGGSGGGDTSSSSPSSSSGANGSAAFNAAVDGIVNPSTKAGGTLNLVATADCDSWDPARTYYGWCWNMQRLFTRSLVGYSKVNGSSFTLAPDLATSLGKHNANDTEWTYTLQKGLKWSDGKPITPMDVKYGIERLYASDVITGGPTFYFTGIINAPKNYAGPYKDGDLPNSAISIKGQSITFHLSTPFGDFDSLMAMAAASPVPYKTEGGTGFVGANYTKHPMASGPFEIKSYTPNQSIDFVRNPYWKQSTDQIRHPLVNAVDLTIDSNSSDADQKIEAGTYDAKADTVVEAAFQAKILTQPSLKAQADDPTVAETSFLTVMPSVIPNVYCRQAIFYATNKSGLLADAGGAAAGVVANTMTPPGIPGYDATSNMYPTGSNSTGDVAKAKAALKKCGKPNGFSTKMAYNTSTDINKKLFQTEQSALARVGITITPAPNDASTYYSTFIGSPSNIKSQGLGITENGWGADFPTGYGFWFSISDGNAIASVGNSNYPSLNDPTVNSVLQKSLNGQASAADFKTLDTAIMKTATYLPYRFAKELYYRAPRLTNVTCDNALAFGIYDFVNAGVGG